MTQSTLNGLFFDVVQGSRKVEWAEFNGIVLGYGDGHKGLLANMTRKKLTTILYRYAQFKGKI